MGRMVNAVQTRQVDAVTVVTLSRPDVRNAVDADTARAVPGLSGF
jgi:enoyl-CoA hydratase/carnithine racemase